MNECTFDMQIPCVSGCPLYVRYPDPHCILHLEFDLKLPFTHLKNLDKILRKKLFGQGLLHDNFMISWGFI